MKAPASLTPGQAGFLSDPALIAIMSAVEAAGGEIRVNGGAIRNALLGEEITDVDLSTTLEPAHVTDVLLRAGIKVVPTGIDHGTVTAVSGSKGFEITTLREDIETDGRHAVVRFGTDWVSDARRRDFTLNALYCDRTGRIFDPLEGYPDLVSRRIRFIGDPAERIAEDRLRILRFFRFFAWYGHGRPDAEGLKACVRARDGLNGLSAERVWHEFRRLLSAPDPVRAILWIRTSGVLDIVLPESRQWGADLIPRLAGVEKELGWRPDPMLRLMAMIPPREETVTGLSTRLKLSNAEAARLLAWARARLPGPETSPDELEKLLYRGDPSGIIDRLMLERARLEESPGEKDRRAREEVESLIAHARAWRKPVFPLKGQDLLASGMAPGPQMGKRLAELETRWVESGFTIDKAQLLAMAGKTAG
ncbi:MAG: CCA tRNA nucleotidyltransferase [Nitratireductor sp.]|nr:CCA tRNA nucleotidyltransferase [Nitratireductor sp.]